MTNRLLTYNPETEGAEGGLLILGVPTQMAENPSSELEELELASAFLEATSDGELATVLNRILRRGAMLAGKPIDPQVAQHLGSRLRRAGQSVRTLLAPPVGRSDGGDISEAMGRIAGAELEGLSDEDKEFETARAFVRFAMEAGRLAAKSPPTQRPAAIATAATRVAARRYAPGLDVVQPQPRFRARRAIRRQSFA
jgi:hypothetical protein